MSTARTRGCSERQGGQQAGFFAEASSLTPSDRIRSQQNSRAGRIDRVEARIAKSEQQEGHKGPGVAAPPHHGACYRRGRRTRWLLQPSSCPTLRCAGNR